MSVQTSEKGQGVIETFITGAKKGWNVAINTIMPAMVLGYVLVQAFNVTGIMTVLGNLCGPVMGLFGLPGEAVTVLISAFFAKAAGAATAFNLYQAGIITAAQATICIMPSMLMGTLVGHYARIVLVTETNKKYTALMFLVPIVDSVLGMLIMRLLLTLMGLM
ncbi:MAG: nucleoside recognition protein [Clostridiales bacterium]|nr:nucleoside recognition protein [Clostridiales bacterium]